MPTNSEMPTGVPEGETKVKFSPDVQISSLHWLVEHGVYFKITPDTFPDIPPTEVGIAKFWATDKAIERMMATRDQTTNKSLKEKLGILATDLLNERDETLNSGLGNIEGEINEELLNFQHKGKNNLGELRGYVALGLVEEIDKSNLTDGLSPKSIQFIRLLALNNRFAELKSFQSGGKVGFDKGKDIASSQNSVDLRPEIEATERQTAQALRDYMGK